MTTVHDFATSLDYGCDPEDDAFWAKAYKAFFPDYAGMSPTLKDAETQRRGTDRVVILHNGRAIRIDEKKRKKRYSDFCLEYLSNDRTGAPGWMEKPLPIDFLAYAFMDSQEVYMLPWDALRRVWLRNRNVWKEQYRPHVEALNKGYKTISVPVPIAEVYRAIGVAYRVSAPSIGMPLAVNP